MNTTEDSVSGPPARISRLAVLALILAVAPFPLVMLISAVSCYTEWLRWMKPAWFLGAFIALSPLAVLTGLFARRHIRRQPGKLRAARLATVAVILGVLHIAVYAAMTPSFYRANRTSRKNACRGNMRQLDSATEQWAMVTRATNGTPIDVPGICQFIKGNVMPTCPGGGSYTVTRLGDLRSESVRCSLHGSLWSSDQVTPAVIRTYAIEAVRYPPDSTNGSDPAVLYTLRRGAGLYGAWCGQYLHQYLVVSNVGTYGDEALLLRSDTDECVIRR